MADSKWKRGLIEFAAIFLGVSLSFLADDWRDSLGQRRQAVSVLEGVANDLDQERQGVEVLLDRSSTASTAGLWLQSSWSRRDAPRDSIETALRDLSSLAPYLAVRAAYESAKASGGLEFVGEELRGLIVALYEREQADLADVVDLSTALVFETQRALRPYIDLEAPEDGPRVVRLGVGWDALRGEREVRNLIAESTELRELVVGHARGYLERHSELSRHLSAALDRR